jgi:UDP-glucose 4-epimerase
VNQLAAMKLSILFTGGTGYIGSHAVAELMAAVHQVIVVDKPGSSKAVVLERFAGR